MGIRQMEYKFSRDCAYLTASAVPIPHGAILSDGDIVV